MPIDKIKPTVEALLAKKKKKKGDDLWPLMKEKYDTAIELRKPFEERWLLTMSFISGKQYAFYNRTAEMLQYIIARKGRVRVIDNKILPRFRKQVSRLIRTRPTMSVVPNSTDQEDIDAAKVGDRALKWFWRTNQMQKKSRELGGWIYATGNAFLDDRWNPKKGPTQVNDKGELVYAGDVDCGVWGPFDILVPCTAVGDTDLHSQPWLIKAKYRPLEWIQNNYTRGKEVQAEDKPPRFINTNVVLGTSAGAALGKVPGVICMELYIQPNIDYPNGLFITGANGVILQKSDYPFDFYNLEHFKDIEIPGIFYGMSTSEPAVQLQKLWNRTLSDIAEYNRTMGRGKWMSPRGANMQEVPDDSMGQVIEYTAKMGQKPDHLTLKGLPATYQQVLNILMQGFMELYHQHEVTQGTNKSDIRSGDMVQLLLEQDDFGNVPTHAVYEESMEAVMTRVLKRMAKGYTAERTIQIVGRDNEFEVTAFKGADLRNNTDVSIKRESSLPTSRMGRESLVMKKYETGLYGPPQDPEVRRHVMNMLDDAVVKDIYSDTHLDEMNARYENRIIMGSLGKKLMINRYDDHAIHIAEHNRFRKSKDFQNARQAAYTHGDRKALDAYMIQEMSFEVHIRQHEAFMNKIMQQRMAEMQKMKGGR